VHTVLSIDVHTTNCPVLNKDNISICRLC